MRHIALYLGIAAALVASCSVKERITMSFSRRIREFYASFEQPAVEGRKSMSMRTLCFAGPPMTGSASSRISPITGS
jgi:hypothetical protein